MYPSIFGISTYSIMLVLALVAAMLLFRVFSTVYKLSNKAFTRFGYISLISVAFGFVFAFLFQLLYNVVAGLSTNFNDVGITFLGGLVGGVCTFFVLSLFTVKGDLKKETWTMVCIAPLPIVAAHCLGRIGCFFAGCCYGKPTSSIVGVLFMGESQKRIPTQLFESIFLAILFFTLLILVLKFKRYNVTMPVYLFAYSIFRFIIEFYRGDEQRAVKGILSPSQWQSIFLFFVATALTVFIFVFKRVPFNGKKDLTKSQLSKFTVL